jgi:hypothetical protein
MGVVTMPGRGAHLTRTLHIRIFLSSPGDVAEERAFALKAIEQLSYRPQLRGEITVEVVTWDKPGVGPDMLASWSPQAAISQGLPLPSACDIVVVIFWSHMGTPLPAKYVKPREFRFATGTKWEDWRYFSCTEWVYVDAMQGAKDTGRPYVAIYHRTAEPAFKPSDPELMQKYEQWQLVQKFFASLKNRSGPHHICVTYSTPGVFYQWLEMTLDARVGSLFEHRAGPAVSKGPVAPPPRLWTGSPFPGLRAFMPDDAPLFFGREYATSALLKRVSEQRFVAVVGVSGTGKSSLVGAGLIPHLKENALPGSKDWRWVRFTPGEVDDNPVAALAAQLGPLVGRDPRDLTEELGRPPYALGRICDRVLKGRPKWAELLLFIDQLEELFTVVSPNRRLDFLHLLDAAAVLPRLRIVATLRVDFYHRCLQFSVLHKLLVDGTFPLGAPGEWSLMAMLHRPADRAGLNWEDEDLPEFILYEVGPEPGALPLMAYALEELYQACRQGDGKTLSRAAYISLGGVRSAIGTRAHQAFAGLDAEAQAALPLVLTELVAVDIEGTPTRKRASLDAAAPSDAARRLIDRLAEARLLVQSHREGYDQPVVEVAHDAILGSWPTLKAWIDRTKDDLSHQQQVREGAE